MNTKVAMTSIAILLGAAGVILTFAPDVVLKHLGISINETKLLAGQVVGGMYFGYGMLNWMSRKSRIGGIYNRPIAVANFSHFFIGTLAIGKFLAVHSFMPLTLWVVSLLYLLLAIIFGIFLFRESFQSSGEPRIQHPENRHETEVD